MLRNKNGAKNTKRLKVSRQCKENVEDGPTVSKKKTDEPEKCFYCDHSYQSSKDLKEHIMAKHEENATSERMRTQVYFKYKCPKCDYVDGLTKLRRHYELIHIGTEPEKLFKCRYCPVECWGHSERYQHEKRHFDADGKLVFKCFDCSKKFEKSNVDEYVAHYNMHYNERPYKCRYCSRKFVSAYQALNHEKLNHPGKTSTEITDGLSETEHCELESLGMLDMLAPGPERNQRKEVALVCNLCNKKMYGARNMRHHLQAHEGVESEKLFKCKYCPVECWGPSERYQHEKRHFNPEGKLIYDCYECSKKFEASNLEKYAAHYNMHYNERPYSCRNCPRKFVSAYMSLKHEKINHPGKTTEEKTDGLSERERRYLEDLGMLNMLVPGPERNENNELALICNHCNKKIYGAKFMKLHLRIHGERKFECDKCDYRTKTSGLLKHHLKITHRTDRPFTCTVCGQSFKLQGALTQHKPVHDIKKHCKCNDCGEEFEDEYMYQLHVKSVHGGTLKCYFCEDKFLSREERILHIKGTHPEKYQDACKICGEPFRLRTSLAAHMKTHEPNKQTCVICNEGLQDEYSLIQHANTKHDGRRFQCTTCGAMFCKKRILKGHMKDVHKVIIRATNDEVIDGIPYKERLHLEAGGWLSMLAPGPERDENGQLAFNCNKCGEKVYGYKKLRTHLAHHGEGRYKCEHCNYCTDDANHFRRHASVHIDRRNTCTVCGKVFRRQDFLRRHEKSHESRSDANLSQRKSKKRRSQQSGDSERESIKDEHYLSKPPATEYTQLPMAVALHQELIANQTSYCIVWAKKLESDVYNLVLKNPGRCSICVPEQNNKTIVPNKIITNNKFIVSINLPNENLLKISVYSFEPEPISTEFTSLVEFVQALKQANGKMNVVHILRDTKKNNLELLSEVEHSRKLICNYVEGAY